MVAVHRDDVQRVLYVDDDPVARRIFEQLGKTAQVSVDVCGSLDEAFALARQVPYSVIAADYSLRRWDGLSVLRELSGLQSDASLMLVTDAERRRELPSSLLKYEFVEKPIRRAKVLTQLSEALSAYEDRTSTPHAALLSAPILLLSASASTTDYLARCVAERGEGRLRVSRARDLREALNMLNSLRFAAALIDPHEQAESGRELVEALHGFAPRLPVVIVGGDDVAPSRSLQVAKLPRDVSAELLVHALCGAVERAERERAIDELSQTDLTTGARNRPTFFAQLAERVKSARPFVLAALTVEGLTDINEELGHLRGDAVLAASVARLSRELGPLTLVGRLSGGTFAVLAEQSGDEPRAQLLKVVRQVFEQPFDLNDRAVRVGVRAVALAYPEQGHTAEELLRNAERALREERAR